ncbi:MAG: Replicative DNA helicase (DnaB), partial [uncultured Nocardioides sp.]
EHHRGRPARVPARGVRRLGRRPLAVRAGRADLASRRPHAAAGQRRGAERAGLDAALQGRHRRRVRGGPRRRLLPARARDHPRRDHRPVRPRRAGRPGDRRRRAPAAGRAAARRWRAVPPHALGQRADRRQRLLLRRDRAREGDPAPPRRRRHQDRPDRLRRRGPGRRRGRPGPGGGLQDHRPAHRRGLRPAERHHERRPRRDRGHRQPRGGAVRRPDRLRRPRRPHQRPAQGPDDHRRGPPRDGEVDARARPVPRGLDPEQHDQRLLQPRDDALGDHHAPALGRGEGAAQPHPQRQHERGRLGQARQEDGRGVQRADVHRRLAQHDHDGDPCEGQAAQAAPRPQADRHRLHAADELGQEGRVTPARGVGVLPPDQAPGQGARGADHRALPAQPRPRAAQRQAPDDERPARVRLAGAGRRHGDPAAPRRRLREGVHPPRRGRPDRGQAPQRPHPRPHRRLPGPLLPLRRHGSL